MLLEAVEPPCDGACQYEYGNLAEATIYFVLCTLLGTYTYRGKAYADITYEEHQRAKAVVYGMLFGQSAASLAGELNIQLHEARSTSRRSTSRRSSSATRRA